MVAGRCECGHADEDHASGRDGDWWRTGRNCGCCHATNTVQDVLERLVRERDEARAERDHLRAFEPGCSFCASRRQTAMQLAKSLDATRRERDEARAERDRLLVARKVVAEEVSRGDLVPARLEGGEVIWAHPPDVCVAPCSVHSPSDHALRAWPQHWRGDRGLMERTCPHGVGHPDPDHMAFFRRVRGDDEDALAIGCHGCDGCCVGNNPDQGAAR